MKIKVLAGRFELPDWAEQKAFWRWMETRNKDTMEKGSRFIHVKVEEGITKGLNCFSTNRKNMLQLQRKEGEPATLQVVTAEGLSEANNFFVRHDNGAFVFTGVPGKWDGAAVFRRAVEIAIH